MTTTLQPAYQSLQTILAVQDVLLEHTKRYGIVDVGGLQSDLVKVRGTVEKPSAEASSTLAVAVAVAVAGRYILTPGIFDSIRQQPKGACCEIQLTDGIAGLLHIEGVVALRYEGTRYECGRREAVHSSHHLNGDA